MKSVQDEATTSPKRATMTNLCPLALFVEDVALGEIPEPDHDEPGGVIPVSGDDSPAIYKMLALADENENLDEMYSSKQMITTTVAENATVVSDDHETSNPKILEEEVLTTKETCPSAWTIAKFATKFPQVFKTFVACLQDEGLPTRVLADLGLFTRLTRRGEQTDRFRFRQNSTYRSSVP